jgi:hypothetical protein
MTPRFWRLQQPEYGSDYQSTYVNGDFDRSHAMPGIKCETCGATWASSHVMPYACPVAMQAHPEPDRSPSDSCRSSSISSTAGTRCAAC